MHNLERQREAARRYHAEHRAECNANMSVYQNETRIIRSERQKDWRHANPGVEGLYQNRRRARKLNAFGSHTQAEWRSILESQRGKCAECNSGVKLEKDHIVPLSRGGSDMAVNLQGLCRSCNASKAASIAAGTQIAIFDKVEV